MNIGDLLISPKEYMCIEIKFNDIKFYRYALLFLSELIDKLNFIYKLLIYLYYYIF